MNNAKVTYGVWLDTRYKLKNNKFQVKIRVTYQRETKYYPITESKFLPWEFTRDDWETIAKGSPRGRLKDVQLEKNAIEVKLRDAINGIKDFSFDKFAGIWYGRKSQADNITLFACLKDRISLYKAQKRISTADNAKSILNSFREFFDNEDPSLDHITVKKLKEYENWMRLKGKSLATVGVYTRELRAMFNDLIKDGLIDKELYPFGEGKYQPPKGTKIKSAITKDEVLQILNYQASELTKEAFSRDLWIFSYLCNGMNLKDISLLKYGDIQGDFVNFKRSKTIRSNRTIKTISVPLIEMAKAIIDKWGNTDRRAGEFIFPILDKNDTAEDVRRKVSNQNGLITDTMKRIVKKLGLKNSGITSNSARDAFATISLRLGRPLSDISKSLGHSSIAVTEHYFGGFADDEKFQWQNDLI